MGKVKPINQYRLTPGFGGLALCHIKQQSAAFHAAGAASKRGPLGKRKFFHAKRSSRYIDISQAITLSAVQIPSPENFHTL